MSQNTGERIKGKVHTYSETVDSGVLVSEENNKYLFSKKDWLSELSPEGNLRVTFITSNNIAKSILLDVIDLESL